MGKIADMIECEQIRERGTILLEELISTLLDGNIVSVGKFFMDVLKTPYFIREELFWQNFMVYLDGACPNEEDLRRFASMLAAGNHSNENAKRIIKTIGDIGTKKKAIFISNLTRACCMKYIEISKFFKLSQCIVRLTEEDLDFLNENISNDVITEDEEYIDDFRNCGLLKEVEGGFIFTKRAYELIKFSLDYENNIDIPERIPKRLVIEMATSEDIDRIIEGTYADDE